ncbi:DUF2252 family protein [Brevundimonas goettingensis]|uniref:DUF2252 family protein n=1 Tax=Brevundimonas goettingensis TaxID=2774190 RepID=A0A975C3K2_9CAUL|nr:DUF2252 family protein [Brevundimonas goettingensis]QTC92237.1 DUF2252 family protein [Brevundimonas goettingensis]
MTHKDIARSPSERQANLTRSRRLKMARSAHAYVRGSTKQFYDWLESSPALVPEGPPVWICGDCHIGNLGPIADHKGRVAIQIRDLDQTVIGNPAHDIIRLGLSLASALRGSDLPGVTTARVLEALMVGYQAALDPAAEGDGNPGRSRLVERLLSHSMHRRWPELAQDRLDGAQAKIALGKRFWPLTTEEREAIGALLEDDEIRSRVLRAKAGRAVRLVDAAYWMKGCSSLGRSRYAALVRIGSGKSASTRLIDIKAAVAAAAPRSEKGATPRDNGQRVLTGARALSPHLGDRMGAGRLDRQAVTVRELAPQDLKIELSQTTSAEAVALATYLGGVVGEAHGRQMSEPDRTAWNTTLAHSRSTTLDAPSWLWSSVVELMGLHEAAYLEHCRQYALQEAA